MAKTETPCPRVSAARFSLSRYNAVLLTTYADSIGVAAKPIPLETLTMRP